MSIDSFLSFWKSHRIYLGEDEVESFFSEVPTFLGLPTVSNEEDKNKPNVVTATSYYGDTYPDYYTQQDKYDVDNASEGVPRYALILAKYASHIMQRTGASQVNFISGSMGALVTRYMIEKDLETLASQKKIARWMTIEGVVNGNYATSKSLLYKIVDEVDEFSIDTKHMKYDWVEKTFGSPKSIGQSPYYKDILIGSQTSTKDNPKEHALTILMLARGQFQPNDGVQAARDTYFSSILEPYRFNGQNPTHSYLHENHLGVKDSKSLWMQIGNFILSNKRVKITILDAKVDDISEKDKWYLKRLPAEIIFESEVFSPEVSEKWGVDTAMSERLYSGALPQIVKYKKKGQTKDVNQVIYNDFVLPTEDSLDVTLTVREIDGDVRYEVYESFKDKDDDFIGSTDFNVPLENGIYTFTHEDFSGRVQVEIVKYPFLQISKIFQ